MTLSALLNALKGVLVVTVMAVATPAMASGNNPPISIGLAAIRDWGTQQPFVDIFKTARLWIGHRPNRWGGMTFEELQGASAFDAQGWPTLLPDGLAQIGTLVLTDLPPEADFYAGSYVLFFEGEDRVTVGGRARNVKYGDNEIRFDFDPGPGSVDIRVSGRDAHSRNLDVRNITVIRADHLDLYEAGILFNPDWLAHLEGSRGIRFMDWMGTNNSTQSAWQDRPRPEDFSYSWRGAPVEIMIELANRLGSDPWFNMPHLADDGYVQAFAETVYEKLATDLKVYVEYSNEVWNWQFDQALWAENQASARWGEQYKWTQFYAMRGAEVARIWSSVFSGEARQSLINVIATQTGWLGLEADLLEAPLYLAENRQEHSPPWQSFDAYAITGYFGRFMGSGDFAETLQEKLAESRAAAEEDGNSRGLQGRALDAHIRTHRFDMATSWALDRLRAHRGQDDYGTVQGMIRNVWPYHFEVAKTHDLDLVVYEAGTHVAGIGPLMNNPDIVAFFTHLNYSPGMGDLYDELVQGWAEVSGGLFTFYNDVQAPTKWGSWGTLRYLGDSTSRWDVIESFK